MRWISFLVVNPNSSFECYWALTLLLLKYWLAGLFMSCQSFCFCCAHFGSLIFVLYKLLWWKHICDPVQLYPILFSESNWMFLVYVFILFKTIMLLFCHRTAIINSSKAAFLLNAEWWETGQALACANLPSLLLWAYSYSSPC